MENPKVFVQNGVCKLTLLHGHDQPPRPTWKCWHWITHNIPCWIAGAAGESWKLSQKMYVPLTLPPMKQTRHSKLFPLKSRYVQTSSSLHTVNCLSSCSFNLFSLSSARPLIKFLGGIGYSWIGFWSKLIQDGREGHIHHAVIGTSIHPSAPFQWLIFLFFYIWIRMSLNY